MCEWAGWCEQSERAERESAAVNAYKKTAHTESEVEKKPDHAEPLLVVCRPAVVFNPYAILYDPTLTLTCVPYHDTSG